jgi:hypothetical protein
MDSLGRPRIIDEDLAQVAAADEQGREAFGHRALLDR